MQALPGGRAPPSRDKTNNDLLHMDFVPKWFQTEQTLGLPHGQLKEALIHLRCACLRRRRALLVPCDQPGACHAQAGLERGEWRHLRWSGR